MFSELIKKSKSLFSVFSQRQRNIHQLEIIENNSNPNIDEVIEKSMSLYTEVYADLMTAYNEIDKSFNYINDHLVVLKLNYKNNFELIEQSESKILWLTRDVDRTLVIANDLKSPLKVNDFNNQSLSHLNKFMTKNLLPQVDLLTLNDDYESATRFDSKKLEEVLKVYNLVILILK